MTTFLNGLSWQGNANNLSYVMQIGGNAVRTSIPWKDVEPYLLPKGTAEYAVNWHKADRQVLPYLDAGLEVIVAVGAGFNGFLPLIGEGERLTPDAVGAGDYIYYICRHVAALVDRYQDVFAFALELELNEAPLTTLFGWRDGALWKDEAFLTDLIQAMSEAAECAMTALCLHTDIHENIHHHSLGGSIAGRKSWREWLTEWHQYADIIGIDTYPNYYTADPNRGHEVGERVAEAIAITGKPVMVMETSYPVPKPGDSLPDPVDFTEAKQAEYVKAAYESSVEAGAAGFFYFAVQAGGVRNNYTARDLKALRVVGDAFHDGDIGAIVPFVMRNMDYCQNQLPGVLQNVESGLGIVRADGTTRPAFEYLRSQYVPDAPGIQNIALREGWNLISIYIQPDSSDLKEVLGSIAGKFKTVWTRQGDKWVWYIVGSESVSNLHEIEPGIGYWIQMTEPAVLIVEGEEPDVKVKLKEGWNLVGYPHSRPCEVREYLRSIAGKYRGVWESDQGVWRWYLPGSPVSSTLTIMRPGYGYWIEVTENCVLKN